ncbi:hypothetical protein [Salipiger bermudensis]|uniref:Copper-binding protein n=1 Tax=Salipiger bermudensis (strain DSM 26914 / JCM 13377 / KCTC 12554 / HTCC2601) TaxID=314265 RepID=Q0FS99_SALBH|nr:hypothetical protein [Salipiger bermudensis]EAU47102.1 hypothetical protein R2601_05023 [Salipiger bermudensis HTCC2601]MBN9675312.1 hypothetical protein [Salipiger bermudensis]MBR9891827.1 hypothetical protein [bacterium]MCA1284295.1 hypothetical protein [Salipiger bermudensis]
MKFPLLAAAFSLLALPAAAHDFGFAGVLSNTNKGEMPGILLSVGQPLTDGPIALKSGMVYELEIEADGSGELALEGSGFFRAIWVNEVVVNGLEIRPFGLESVEFDEAGTMEIEFLAIKPGRYFLRIPGSTGESQRVEISIQ